MSYQSQSLAALLFAVSLAATAASSAEQELRSLVKQCGATRPSTSAFLFPRRVDSAIAGLEEARTQRGKFSA